jgi:hypothetical protein
LKDFSGIFYGGYKVKTAGPPHNPCAERLPLYLFRDFHIGRSQAARVKPLVSVSLEMEHVPGTKKNSIFINSENEHRE